jgi:hypothetical protein
MCWGSGKNSGQEGVKINARSFSRIRNHELKSYQAFSKTAEE